jgi:small-conductance mechanosensitive channel
VTGFGDFDRWRILGQQFLAQIESATVLIQSASILGAGLFALWLALVLKRRLLRFSAAVPARHWLAHVAEVAASLAVPGLWLLLLWIATQAGRAAGVPMGLAAAGVSLLFAWVVIRLLSHVVRNPLWSAVIFFTAWTLAALDILGVLGEIERSLDRLAFPYGNVRISALNIVRAVIVLSVLLWLTGQLRGFLERRIYQAQNLTPSLQALLVQLLKLLLPLIAVLVALPLVGLNLTAVTVFGGAFAVGAGLGLQRAVANLVSGFMLLGSKSIRPGDVIAVKDMGGAKTYGRVNSIGALYVSLRTRDGIDYLVPNDSFLSTGIENWTHADNNVRVKLPFGVAHGSDLKQVIAAALDAAASVPRVLKSPQPVCFLTGYSDSALNFELRFWINDPMNGLSNVRGESLLRMLERFRTEGIRMPFPPAPG